MKRTGGFTLIEMVTSLAVLSILLLACGSVLYMATRATGSSAVAVAGQAQAADAATQIVDDLNVATNFTQRTATAVTFTVPDRLNAGSPQTIKYSWTGVAGDPLLRSFNGGTPATILPALTKLSFGYDTRTAGTAAATEVAVFDHPTASGSLQNYAVTSTKWASQSFFPSLPSGTTSYSITRVRVYMKVSGQDSVGLVSLRQADALGNPTAVVIANAVFYGSALSTKVEWLDIPVSGATNLNPSQGVSVIVGYSSGPTGVCTVQYDQALFTILSSANWATSTNAGSSWGLPSLLSCGMMSVYGTVP